MLTVEKFLQGVKLDQDTKSYLKETWKEMSEYLKKLEFWTNLSNEEKKKIQTNTVIKKYKKSGNVISLLVSIE